jgi:hypothetical protein
MHWPLIGSLISSENDTTDGRPRWRPVVHHLLQTIEQALKATFSQDPTVSHQINFVQSGLSSSFYSLTLESLCDLARFI